jgi:hypothetical protein
MPEKVSGTPQYKCKQCSKILNSEHELRQHERTHEGQSRERSQSAGAAPQSKDRT